MSNITYTASADANIYILKRDENWLAVVQFNGELTVPEQESLLEKMIAGAVAGSDGELAAEPKVQP